MNIILYSNHYTLYLKCLNTITYKYSINLTVSQFFVDVNVLVHTICYNIKYALNSADLDFRHVIS